jgi:hypothetical protein
MSTAAPLSDVKRKLLEKVVQGKSARPFEITTISRRQSGELLPVALCQEQVLIREQKAPRIPPLYNESVTLRFKRPMNTAILERSMAEVIRRHEIWRTSYSTVAGQWVQVVHPAADCFPLPLVDLRRASEREREAHVLKLGLTQTALPFDLRNGPLLRATVVAMTDSEYWLVMSAHQSIIDGASVYQIFPTELFAIYRAFSAGRPSPLPDLPLQFSDFACWQREWLTPAKRAEQIAYWRRKLAGEIRAVRWPTEQFGRPERTFRGHIRDFTFPADMAAAVHTLSRRQGATVFAALLATFYCLLRFYTGQSDLVVGTLSPSGRKRSEVQNLLGYFLNPVALRVDLSDDPSFVNLLRRVQETIAEAISNDDVPLEDVVEANKPCRNSNCNPYFNLAISLQPSMPDSGGAWSVTSMDAESGGAVLDMYIAFIDHPDGLYARVQYNPDILDFNQIRRMVEDFQSFLGAVATRPEERISKVR